MTPDRLKAGLRTLQSRAAYELMQGGDMPVAQGDVVFYRGPASGSFDGTGFSFFTRNVSWRF